MEKIGKIVNTHGIKGEVKISSSSHFLQERFGVGNTLVINHQGKKITLEITSFRLHKNHVLVTFKGYDNINQVLVFKNLEVFQELKEVDLAEDEYMYDDLIGLEVYDASNNLVATVLAVEEGVASDLLVVKNLKNQEKRIPFVKQIVLEVNDKIIIDNLEGLL